MWREHTSQVESWEKEDMDLDLEWKKKVVEKLYLEEEKRVEKKYLLKLGSRMIKYKSLNTSQEFIRILKKKKLNTWVVYM